MYLVLLKVPFNLLRTGLIYKAATPPNPSPSEGERMTPRGMDRVMSVVIKWPAFVSKMGYVADALTETICIIAALLPSHTSRRILSALTDSSTTSLSTFIPSFSWALFTGITIIGGFFRLSAYHELGRHFTFELALLKDHKLITTGPYSVVRHPSYTGALALFGGSALTVAAPGSWTRHVLIDGAIRDGFSSGPSWAPYARSIGVMMTLLLFISVPGMVDRARREDEMLKREFGKEWENWTQRTPYRLIPGIY